VGQRAANAAPWEDVMALTRKLVIGTAFVVGLSIWSGWAVADEEYGPLQVAETPSGKILTDEKGMALYTFDKDEAGKSNCSGECAQNWPPAAAPADAKPVGDLTLIKRDDGTMQWADDGKPLYTYVDDKKPGEVTGDGKNGVWHVVKED
jgi:predicted lipoprotein with Yx(FWY)xxD motif